MKNLLLLTAMLFTFTMTIASNDPIIIHIQKAGNQKIEVQLANLEKKRTSIFIQDVKGNTWVTDYAWNEAGYNKMIDMSDMPTGDYLVVVTKQRNVYAKAFTLTPKYLIFFETEKKNITRNTTAQLVSFQNKNRTQQSIIANIRAQDKNVINIQLANLQSKPVTTNLYHIGNTSALEDKVAGENGYNKDWNLSGMPYGSYYVHVQTPEESILVFFDFTVNGIVVKSKQHLFMPSTNGILAKN